MERLDLKERALVKIPVEILSSLGDRCGIRISVTEAEALLRRELGVAVQVVV